MLFSVISFDDIQYFTNATAQSHQGSPRSPATFAENMHSQFSQTSKRGLMTRRIYFTHMI